MHKQIYRSALYLAFALTVNSLHSLHLLHLEPSPVVQERTRQT